MWNYPLPSPTLVCQVLAAGGRATSLLCFLGTFLRSSQRCGCMRSPGAAHTAAVEWWGFGELVLLLDWMGWIPKPIQARKYQNECRLMLCCYVLSCLFKLNIKLSMHVHIYIYILQICVTYRQRASYVWQKTWAVSRNRYVRTLRKSTYSQGSKLYRKVTTESCTCVHQVLPGNSVQR